MSDKLLAGRRVLVVEDEVLILFMIEGMLADLGCENVTAAANIKHAIALIEAEGFDAAMLDMNLNGRDSGSVAEALARRGVPFVYSTGNGGWDMRAGYNECMVLRKPFSFEELTDAMTLLTAAPKRPDGST